MKMLLAFVLVFLFFTAGSCEDLRGTKQIKLKINCDTIQWDLHSFKQCNMTIDITGFKEFPYSYENFLTDDISKNSLENSCFKDFGSPPYDIKLERAKSILKERTRKSLDNRGKYTCSEMSLTLKNAKRISGCIFVPKKKLQTCKTFGSFDNHNFTLTFSYDIDTQKNFLIKEQIDKKNGSSSFENCSFAKRVEEHQILNTDYRICKDIEESAPMKCRDERWNEYEWNKCTYDNLRTYNVDYFSPHPFFEDLRDYCGDKAKNLNNCVTTSLCEQPVNGTFYYYSDLKDHFLKICGFEKEFQKQRDCLNKARDKDFKKFQKARIDFDKCFYQAISSTTDFCSALQLWLLCRPLLFESLTKGCTTFDEMYQFDIKTRDFGKCSNSFKEKLDPCKTELDAKSVKCAGGLTSPLSAVTISICAIFTSLYMYFQL